MNHKQLFTHGIMLVLVVLLTACAAPTGYTCQNHSYPIVPNRSHTICLPP